MTPLPTALFCSLKVTKYVHLHGGDHALTFLFDKLHALLAPGGLLVLQAQHFRSYRAHMHLTAATRRHYGTISLFPNNFPEYLVRTVGFDTAHYVTHPPHGGPDAVVLLVCRK